MVLDIGQQDGPKPKCYFTHATLPSHIDAAHPPAKKEPFRTVFDQPYSHTLSLVMPSCPKQQEFERKIFSTGDGTLQYARVYMKPLELISGDFFNSYIKSGDVVMLSEGRSGTDTVISLSDGILRIEVDKPTYEKLGLEGKVVGSEGRKHIKARFAIEINLRLPSMFPGKKAFDRLTWAFKNVLDASLAWLFYDLRSPQLTSPDSDGTAPQNAALAAHAPTIKTVIPDPIILPEALVPPFKSLLENDDEESQRDETTELLEWLSLAMSRSPRVLKGDSVDPYLCRYRPTEAATPTELVLYQWHGFAPAAFVQKILLAAMKSSAGDGWFALCGASFEGKGYMVLRDGGDVMTWNFSD